MREILGVKNTGCFHVHGRQSELRRLIDHCKEKEVKGWLGLFGEARQPQSGVRGKIVL
jgi:hypothetical protein